MKRIVLIVLLITSFSGKSQCWESVSAGLFHGVGIQTDGTLWAWGNSDNGALGNGSISNDIDTPQQVGSATDWKEVTSGYYNNFAIKDNGTLWAWGTNIFVDIGSSIIFSGYGVPTQIGTSQWKTSSAGVNHFIGIKSDGTLWAWGKNDNFQLGNGTQIDSPVPILIDSSTNWKMVSCSLNRNIALKEDGTIWVWGDNYYPLGITDLYSVVPYITIPTQVGTDTDWSTVSTGTYMLLAIKTNKTLHGWGTSMQGEYGNGASIFAASVPTQIGTDTDWESIELQERSSFGIKSNGTLWVSGVNIYGVLGNGTLTDVFTFTQITTDTDWKNVSSSYVFTAAVKTDGSLCTWGTNFDGCLGDGEDFIWAPYQVLTPQFISTCSLNTAAFSNHQVSLYPNPVQNSLFIDTDEILGYHLYSILGSKISEGTLSVGNSIDCSNLTSGVYLLNLTNVFGNISTVKFVKQ